MTEPKCPKCGNENETLFWGVEYDHNHPEHIDGVSEWICTVCETAFGRWTKRILINNDYERKYGRE